MKNSYSLFFILYFLSPNTLLAQSNDCFRQGLLEEKTIILTEPCLSDDTYKLVFQDHFNTSLDTINWRTDYPYGEPYGRLHNPQSNAVNLKENIRIENGIAHLTAKTQEYLYEWTDENGDYQSELRQYSSAVLHSRNQTEHSDHPSGCWFEGNFEIRAKIPSEKGINSAFWFFGWPGEIDVFEFLECPDGDLQSSIHMWNLEECECVASNNENDVCEGQNGFRRACSHPASPADYYLGDLSSDYHIYGFEWTPYVWRFSIDGKLLREFHRFYIQDTIHYVDGNGFEHIESNCRPINCSELPKNKEITLFEHRAWEHYQRFNIDLILSSGVHTSCEKEPKEDNLAIDWVKVWQKTDVDLYSGYDGAICQNENTFGRTFWIGGGQNMNGIEWRFSENIVANFVNNWQTEIFATNENLQEWAWIEVSVPNPTSCHERIIRKDIWLGEPLPTISVNSVLTPCHNIQLVSELPNLEAAKSYEWIIDFGEETKYFNTSTISFPYSNRQNTTLSYQLQVELDCNITATFSDTIQLPDCSQQFLQILPNPALTEIMIDVANIDLQTANNQPINVLIINTNGQLIQQEQVEQLPAKININSLPAGLYFVYIEVDNKRLTSSKLIKM